MINILNNVYIWHGFRKLINIFGVYKKRIKIIKNAGISGEMSIIDIACGIGQYSIFGKNKYLGVDLNQEYINYARKIYKENENKKFICADVNTFNFGDSLFNTAFLIDVIHHMTDKENEKLFKTINKIIDNFIIICDPIKQSRYNFIGRLLTSFDRGKHIRKKENLLDLIRENFDIKSATNLKMIGIENICVIAKPKNNVISK